MAKRIPDRFKKAAEFRRKVIRREAKTLEFLERSWLSSSRAIDWDIQKLIRKIAEAQSDGKKVNPDWLRRSAEYQHLQMQIIQMAGTYSEIAAKLIRSDISWAATQGAMDSLELTQLSFFEEVRWLVSFGVLPEETVLEIASRVAPGTPAGDLLENIAVDMADDMRNTLIDGITRGQSVEVVGRDLQKLSGIPATRAQTIARTETFNTYRESHIASMRINEDILSGWIWNAHLETCCGGCMSKHGEVFYLVDYFPAHVNCQCEPVPKPKTFEEMGFDPSLDELFPDPSFNYDKMKADARAQLDVDRDALAKRFGAGKAELLDTGQIGLEDLGKTVKSDIWGDSIVEVSFKDVFV